MNNYDIEYMEQKIFEMVISKAEDSFYNNGHLNFRVDDLTKLLQVNTQILQDNMSGICKKLLRRNVEINHENGNWETISVIMSVKYGDNSDLLLDLNPEIKSHLQYLNRQ